MSRLLATAALLIAAVFLSAAAAADPESVPQLHGITKMHNVLRCQYGAGPLAWDTALAAQAQAYTDRCVFA